jgi:hypothetical protein
MVSYRAMLDVDPDLVSWLENLIATRRCEAGGSWNALTSWDTAVLFLVFLHTGDGFAQLGAHFGIGTQTAWRYIDDTITALAPLAPSLSEAINAAGPERRLLLDGTLIPTWRCASIGTETNADPLYNGKHRDHGMTVQALSDATGRPVFLGDAHPGSVHDLAAARADGIIEQVTATEVETLADSGYQGAGGTVRTPIKRRRGLHHSEHEKHANSEHARHRVPVERAFAHLKRWRVLDRVRISPNRISNLLKALFVVHRKRSSLARA